MLGIEGSVERSPHGEALGLIEQLSYCELGVAIVLLFHHLGAFEDGGKIRQLAIRINVLPQGLVAGRIGLHIKMIVCTSRRQRKRCTAQDTK